MTAPVFSIGGKTERPSQFGRIQVPYEPWLALQPEEEVLDPGLTIVDPHHHLWDYQGFRYLVPEFARDLGGHNVISTVYAECLSMYRVGGPARYRPLGEIEFAVGQSAESASGQHGPARIAQAIIGFADLNLGAEVEEVLLAELDASNGRLKGTRFTASWDPAPEIAGSPHDDRAHLLAEAPVRGGLRALARLGLTYDCWLFFTQLGELAAVADAIPELTIVVDHCGGPLGYGPYAQNKAEHYRAWKTALFDLAQRPNVMCKIGGLLGRGAAFDYLRAERPPTSQELADIWRPWFEPAMEAFGPDRSMFESNFPLEKMGTSYKVLWNCFKRVASGVSDAERTALFSGTARRVYRL